MFFICMAEMKELPESHAILLFYTPVFVGGVTHCAIKAHTFQYVAGPKV